MSTISIVDWINSLSESELKDQLVLAIDGQTPTKGNSADKASLSAINNDPNFYEEGTWTPVLTTDGTDFESVDYVAGTSGAGTNGLYVVTGNVVMVNFLMRTRSVTKGSATGNVVISGLPFSIKTISPATPQASMVSSNNSGWINKPSYGAFFFSPGIRLLDINHVLLGVSDVSTGQNRFGGTLMYIKE